MTDGAYNLAVSANGEFAVSSIAYDTSTANSVATLTTQLFDSNLAPIGTALTLDDGFLPNAYQLNVPLLLASLNGNSNLVTITSEISNMLDTSSLVGLLVQQ
jgi:hypothetical protein